MGRAGPLGRLPPRRSISATVRSAVACCTAPCAAAATVRTAPRPISGGSICRPVRSRRGRRRRLPSRQLRRVRRVAADARAEEPGRGEQRRGHLRRAPPSVGRATGAPAGWRCRARCPSPCGCRGPSRVRSHLGCACGVGGYQAVAPRARLCDGAQRGWLIACQLSRQLHVPQHQLPQLALLLRGSHESPTHLDGGRQEGKGSVLESLD